MKIGQLLMAFIIALPFAEIYLLFKFAALLGFMATLGLLLLAALSGLSLIQQQGTSALIRVQQGLARGELPAHEVIRSGVVTLAGVLFILPGFISDLLALMLLFPASRRWLTTYLLNRSQHFTTRSAATSGPTTLEGEFRRED